MFGLRLDPDAVRALHVAAQDRPHDAAEEHEPGRVADEGVRAVDVALQELEILGHLVIDLEHRGDGEKDEEPEVDHRVHEARGGIAQEGLHVGAGAEVLEALGGVLGGRAPLRRCAALPVLHPVGEHEAAPDDHHRDHGVERELQRTRNVDEHLAVHFVVVLPLRDLRQHAGHEREETDSDPEGDGDLVRFDALRGVVGRVVGVGVVVGAHGRRHASA